VTAPGWQEAVEEFVTAWLSSNSKFDRHVISE